MKNRHLNNIWIQREFRSGSDDPHKRGTQTFQLSVMAACYTEFYFTDVPWPDFSKEELEKAIETYNHRDRRYGGVKEEEEQNV